MMRILTCLLAALGLTSVCGQQTYENTDVQGFAELIADSTVVILDVRTSTEFAEGHIQGAILIDQGQDDFVEKAKATLPTEKKPVMVNFCGTIVSDIPIAISEEKRVMMILYPGDCKEEYAKSNAYTI